MNHVKYRRKTDSALAKLFKQKKNLGMDFQAYANPMFEIFNVDTSNKFLSTFSSSDLKSTHFYSKVSYSINQMHLRIIQTNSLQHSHIQYL